MEVKFDVEELLSPNVIVKDLSKNEVESEEVKEEFVSIKRENDAYPEQETDGECRVTIKEEIIDENVAWNKVKYEFDKTLTVDSVDIIDDLTLIKREKSVDLGEIFEESNVQPNNFGNNFNHLSERREIEAEGKSPKKDGIFNDKEGENVYREKEELLDQNLKQEKTRPSQEGFDKSQITATSNPNGLDEHEIKVELKEESQVISNSSPRQENDGERGEFSSENSEGCHPPGKFKCVDCSKNFWRKYDLDRHMRSHTGEKPHKCDICSKSYSEQGHLNRHMRDHTGEKAVKCEICAKSFSRKSSLVTHMRIHTGEKPFKCDRCGQSFTHKHSLSSHPPCRAEDKPYKCQICAKSFAYKSSLNVHSRIHAADKPLKCQICSKRFSHSIDLNRHALSHEPKKQFECDVCSKRYSRKDNLNAHFRRHTEKLPLQCDTCFKRFQFKSELNKHARHHTDCKPFELNQHSNRHAVEKRFKCQICAESFTWEDSWDAHVRVHAGEKPYECESFTAKWSLVEHRRTQENEKLTKFVWNGCVPTKRDNYSETSTSQPLV